MQHLTPHAEAWGFSIMPALRADLSVSKHEHKTEHSIYL